MKIKIEFEDIPHTVELSEEDIALIEKQLRIEIFGLEELIRSFSLAKIEKKLDELEVVQ